MLHFCFVWVKFWLRILYHIMHELVSNALRHSGASHILVEIVRYDDRIENGKWRMENEKNDYLCKMKILYEQIKRS